MPPNQGVSSMVFCKKKLWPERKRNRNNCYPIQIILNNYNKITQNSLFCHSGFNSSSTYQMVCNYNSSLPLILLHMFSLGWIFDQHLETDYSLNSVNNQVTVTRSILARVKVFKCSNIIGIFLLITHVLLWWKLAHKKQLKMPIFICTWSAFLMVPLLKSNFIINT